MQGVNTVGGQHVTDYRINKQVVTFLLGGSGSVHVGDEGVSNGGLFGLLGGWATTLWLMAESTSARTVALLPLEANRDSVIKAARQRGVGDPKVSLDV